MIDLKDLRDNPERYKRAAQLKRIDVNIDRLLELDAKRRSLENERQQLTARKNQISKLSGKEIGQLKAQLNKDKAVFDATTPDTEQHKVASQILFNTRQKLEEVQLKAVTLKEEEHALGYLIENLEPQITDLLLRCPQPPDDDVPIGQDASDNVITRTVGNVRRFEFEPKSHIELGEALGLFDFESGVRLAGSRSYFLKGPGAELHQAILRFAFDLMTREKDFTAMSVPVLVREVAMRGTGFFPAGREQTYHVDAGTENELFLTGTAEVGLTAYHMDEILSEADLPKKYVAISTCFRREAGTYGKDTAGLYRVHQFDKCEQVVICKNDVDESRRWHMEMLGYSEELLQRLELPYRVIQCCTGDIGVKNAAMFDLETWMPSRSAYGETHSASRLYEFQARRLNLRYKDATGKVRFVHTLNNTVVASPRILIPILENYQNADGSITIPTALRPYMNNRDRIAKSP